MELKMEFIIYTILITILALIYFRNYLRTVYICLLLNGPPTLPVVGNCFILKNSNDMYELGNYVFEKYGSLTRFWVSFLPFVFVYEPKHLKIIMGNNKVSKKNILYGVLHNFIGQGLITNNDYAWKKNRKLLQPYFHSNVLEKNINLFSEKAHEMVKNLDSYKEINIAPFLNMCVLSILHRAILGEPLDKNSPYRKGEVLILDRIMKPWLLVESIFKLTSSSSREIQQKLSLHQYTKKIFLKRCSQNYRVKDCLLDIMIDISKENKDFTVDDVINETVTFMLAGQDSVGSALAFTLYFLAKNEDIQEKVIEEIKNVNDDNCLTFEDINKMKYMEQVIKESMRLAPPIPLFARVLTEDLNLDGVILPAGQNIFISPFMTHRLPHIYQNPQKFDPDRFSPENSEKIHPYAFIPFSIGPRMCIGYKYAMTEMKTIIFHLLKAYQISTVPGFEEIVFSYKVSLRAKGGIRLFLKKRL